MVDLFTNEPRRKIDLFVSKGSAFRYAQIQRTYASCKGGQR